MLQYVLSVVSLYILSIHKLCVGQKKLDSIIAKFLWQGPDLKHKYLLVRWSSICKGKMRVGKF
jgi:hypothetical protein